MMIGRLIEICWRGPNVSEDKSKIVALREEEGSMGEVSVHRKQSKHIFYFKYFAKGIRRIKYR